MFEQYNDLVTVEEFYEMLSIGKNAAYKSLASGQLNFFRYNRVWKIPKQGISEYINAQSNLA
jgi:hypothetical protein